MNNRKWYFAGLVYFCSLFVILPSVASAYIDPSITSYAIQAIAGIVIASGAFFTAYGRRAKKGWMRALGMEEFEIKEQEQEIEILDEDLQEEFEKRKEAAEQLKKKNKTELKHNKSRIFLSVLCGFSLALTLILRPIISFYIANEGEFWFSLESVIGLVFLIFSGLGFLVALIHYFLPDKSRFSFRLLFAAMVAAVSICIFVQNHFMSSYLPVLTGDPIDWSLYGTQNIFSIALWIGIILCFLLLTLICPRVSKALIYFVMAFLFCTEAVVGMVDLASAKHENKKAEAYFSNVGLFETSDSGNVVVLISDTFEATYMNQILEEYPEYRDLLSDCTYYDNVTGTSVFTYFSYAKLLTGIDFPIGSNSEQGVKYCFDHQTTVDRILKNGWDVEYFTTFSPTPDMENKILNYYDGRLEPDLRTAWALSKLLVKSTMFQSLPQLLKPYFLAYTSQYDMYKSLVPVKVSPYVEDDVFVYDYLNEHGLNKVEGNPRYSIVQLWGLHNPCVLNEEFETVKYDEDVPGDYRRLQAGRAALKLLRTYLDKLKEAGTYDQTTVIMTADHGFNMRYYPVLLVKEAKLEESGFQINHAPLSMQEDYEDLIAALTSGLDFPGAVSSLNISEDRIRYALDYRSEQYETQANRRSVVQISGDAWLEDSYKIQKDEFLINNDFSGRYVLNAPFITDSKSNDTVSIYGIEGSNVYGHSILFDIFFDSEVKQSIVLKASIRNVTDQPQRILFSIDDEVFDTQIIPVSDDFVQISTALPRKTVSRIKLELDVPDAQLKHISGDILEWNEYKSIIISEAGLYSE